MRTHQVAGARCAGVFVGRLWLFAVIAFCALVAGALAPAIAQADPALIVTKAISAKPLLGGTATYTITVQNTGADKGYDLSLTDVLSSSRPNPQGRVTFVSASDSSGALVPTSVVTNAGTGDTTIQFTNIKDLAPTETYRLTLTVDLSGDPSWVVNDDLVNNVTATVMQFPHGAGLTYTGNASVSADVLPIKLVSKTVQQSTGVEQATGTEDHVFHYQLRVANNYVNTTNSVVVVDTLPDGVEFLGMTSGPALDAGYPQRDAVTGETTLCWTLGNMVASATQDIRYAAGIRYDYYGTDNGGTGRDTTDFDGTPALGAPIPDKTAFVNQADLNASYSGTPVTDQATASVTGAYLTIAKSGAPTSGGNGTIVNYTLIYTASQYYDILQQAPDSITVHDTLPDGQHYNFFSASPDPTSVVSDADGTVMLTWDGAALAALPHSQSATIAFSATVDNDWRGPGVVGLPVIAGDALTNICDVSGVWDDLVDTGRPDATSTSAASAHFGTSLPKVNKRVEDPPASDTWVQTTSRTVGDTVKFRVRFNTTDGATPTNSDIKMGRITVTDWLPPGMTYNNDAVITPSALADFTDPEPLVPPALNVDGAPTVVSLGGLQGLEWYLGDVDRDGWWQCVYTAHIDDAPTVTDGAQFPNLWKLTGINTFGIEYSDRDAVAVDYQTPLLTLTKTPTTVPNPLIPGANVTYTTTIVNSGHAAARDVLITDALPVGMRLAAPTMVSANLNGSPLVAGTGYVLSPAYDSGTGVFSIDLENAGAGVRTPIPAGGTLTLVYRAQVDATGGVAGRSLTNVATVAYNTQHDGSGRATPGTAVVADPNTDDAMVQLAPLAVAKTVSPATPVTIGDTLTYSINVTVPAGEIAYWPKVSDVVNRDGVAFDASFTPTLSTVSGTPVTTAAFTAGTTPTVTTAGLNNTVFAWLLNDPIDNRGQATPYVFRLTFQVLVNGLEDNASWEFWQPTAADQVGDRGRSEWHTTQPASRPATTDRSVYGSWIQSDIDQPRLALAKTVTSSGPYAGGSQVIYQTTITNTGWNTAYDIRWDDTLPAGLELQQLLSVTRGGTPLAEGIDFASDFSGDPQTIDFNGGSGHTSLAAGASIVVGYAAQVCDDVGTGAGLVNTADVDWASKDGAPAGSRVYNDGANEAGYVADTATATITARPAALTKNVTPLTARLGETLTYTVRVTVPAETVAYSPTLADAIATDGLRYVSGSAAVTDVSGSPQTTAVLTGVTEDTSPSPGSAVQFVFQSPIDNANSGHPTGDTDYEFDLTFQMQVTGRNDGNTAWLWSPAGGPVMSTDTATFAWSDGVGGHTSTASASETIQQPVLAMTKTFDNHAPASGDVVVGSTVTIANQGWETAYEDGGGFDFVDTPPACFEAAIGVALTHSVNGVLSEGTDYSVSFAGSVLQIEYTSAQTDLAPGETLSITYQNAFVEPPDTDAPAPGATYTNDAVSHWSSMPGDVGGERVYDLAADDSLTMPLADVQKTCDASGGVASIGEEFDFTVTLDVPAGLMLHDAQVLDTVPDGLTVVSANANYGSATVTPHADGTSTVTWSLPAAWGQTSPPAALLVPTLTVTVRPDDTYIGGAPLSGLPLPLGSGQDTLTNNADFTWHETPGGTSHTASDGAPVTIAEPHLTIAKAFDNHAPASGAEVIGSTVVVGNDGISTAYERGAGPDFVDTPAACFAAATGVTMTHSANGALSEGVDYIVSFSGNELQIEYATHQTDLAPGETLTITYDNAFVQPPDLDGPAPGGAYSNGAVAYAGSDPAGGPAAREYTASADDTLTMAPAGMHKTCEAPGGVASIGEEFDFEVTLDVPWGLTIHEAVIADTVPDGLTVVSTTPSAGSTTAVSHADGTTTVTWALPSAWGQVSAPLTLEEPTLIVTVRVDDTFAGGTSVSGLPAPLGPGQDTLTNQATFTWFDAPAGNSYSRSDTADVTVVEPHLTITKTFDNHTPTSGAEIIGSTVVIGNNGISTAYERGAGFDFVDSPAACFAPATGVALSHSVNGALTEGTDYTVSFSGNQLQIEYTSHQTDLAPGETLTVTYSNAFVQPPDPDAPAAAGSYSNDAAASAGSDPGGGPAAREYVASASDHLTMAGVGIIKTLDAPAAEASIGETFNYTISLTVPAGTTLNDATVADLVPDGLTVVDTNASDGSAVVTPNGDGTTGVAWTLPASWQQNAPPASPVDPTLTVTVMVDDTFAGGTPLNGLSEPLGPGPQDILTNTAELDYVDGQGGQHLQDDDSVDLTIVEPHLTIAKDVDKATVASGDIVNYTVTLTNDGTGAAHALVVTDDLPSELFAAGTSPVVTAVRLRGELLTAGVDYVAALGTNPVTVTLAATRSLGLESTLEIVLTARVNGGVAGGLELLNTATATYASAAGGGATARHYGPLSDDATVATQAPALAVEKTVMGASTVNRYDVVNYQVVVTNSGDSPAYGVGVDDSLPDAALNYVAGSTHAAWDGGSSTADPAGAAGRHLTWGCAATLAPGRSLTLTYSVRLGMIPLAAYTNTARATGVDGAGSTLKPVDDTAQITVIKPAVTDPQVTVSKTLAKGQKAAVKLGDPIKYTITVTNTGSTTIMTLPLVDTYDRGALKYLSASPAPDAVTPAGTLTWNDLTGAGMLLPDESITVNVKFKALRHDGLVVNTADVIGALDEYDDPAPSSRAAANVKIKLKAKMIALKVGKDLNGLPCKPGHIVNWKITGKNVGQATLTNIVIKDAVAKWQKYVQGSIRGPGGDDSSTQNLRWTIKSLKPGKTFVVSFHTVIVPNTPPGAKICNSAKLDSDQTRPQVSDDPFTTEKDDTTVLNPDSPSHWWLLWVALGVTLLGTAVAVVMRRRAQGRGAAATS